jgi:RNA polymerase sigma-54 factor
MLLQRHSPSLRPLTTAHLAQTMTLLELTTVELRQKIEAELAANPALELIEEARCPGCGRVLPGRSLCPICSQPKYTFSEEPIVFLSSREDFYTHDHALVSEEDYSEDDFSSGSEELPAYVLRQIAPELKPEDRAIAAHILTSLDEDGFLTITHAEIARYHFVPLAKVERIIRLIQRAEPLGVGSQTPQEALLVQLEVLGETRPIPALASVAVREGFDFLSRRRYIELGKLLKISSSQARAIACFISDNLNPYPARMHWGDNNSSRTNPGDTRQVYYSPDIIISRLHETQDTPLVVEIALPIRGTLRINPLFREALQQAPEGKMEQWKADMEHASLLVKCIQQRNHTIVRMMQRLVVLQRQFILYGDEFLLPVTRAALADELELHEATISRAVSDKAIQIPNGHIIPLARFFDRSLHIRTTLKKLIEREALPLSDADLATMLAKEGYPVARRTVAKYRAMEGILPAHLRLRLQSV